MKAIKKDIKTVSVFLLALMLILGSCRKDDLLTSTDTDTSENPDWSAATHGIVTDPDYEVVFPDNEVLRIDITISSDNWEAMQDDLKDLLGSNWGGGGPGGGGLSSFSSDPIWVECTVEFNDLEWNHVGIRYKGNSSLQSTYSSGNEKLPFKLDFDEFEDDYSGITDQRFYGFKQLSLKNNYNDKGLMREKVAADLFREFGIPCARTSFCALYIDNGSGPEYYGLYTIVEEPDDTVLSSQFNDGSGNLYKPDGDAATFANGQYDEDEMELKTNLDVADYSDVEALYEIINSADRTNNTESWKAALEGVFNVNHFLKYLAANNTIQNWDTYGIMTHNYYLYNNPDEGLLTWMPWDNNEAFQNGNNGGAVSLSMSEVNSQWPLISYIIAQEEYKAIYEEYLEAFITDVFTTEKMVSLYDKYYYLLRDYAYDERNGCTFINYDNAFDDAVSSLKSHASSRVNAVASYLD